MFLNDLVDDASMELWIRRYDKDNDGLLKYGEFVNALQPIMNYKHIKIPVKRVLRPPRVASYKITEIPDELKTSFLGLLKKN
jgi:hypothetical protein